MEPIRITIEAVILHIPINYEKKKQESIKRGESVPDNEIYEAARGTWNLSEHGRNKVKYALAVVDKKVVKVYRIKQPWNQDVRDDKWAFERHDAEEDAIQKGCKGLNIKDIDGLEMGQSSFCYVQLKCSIKVERTNK